MPANVYCIVNQTMKLSEPTKKLFLQSPLAYDNAMAHAMRVTVVDDNGNPVSLSGIGVTGSFMMANASTVTPIVGSTSGNVAEVILPAACYAVPGRFKFTLNLANSSAGTVRTALWVEGYVEVNNTETIIDPGTEVLYYEEVISRANAAAEAAEADRSRSETAYQLDHTKCTAVALQDNLNAYTTAGNYAIPSYTIAESLINSPSKSAGNLAVMTITTSSHPVILQKYVEYTGLTYTRYRSTNNEVWSDWVRVMDGRDSTLHRSIPVGEHYDLLTNEFVNGKWTNGAYENAVWAYTKAKLNHGSIILFDPSLYQVVYFVLDAATETTQLIQNEGFNSTGRIVVNTQGISDDYIVVVEARPASGSGSVDIYSTGNTIQILNRDKTVDLMLFAGQSNMAGRGTAADAPAVLPEVGLEFRAITDTTRLYPITEPFGVAQNNSSGIDDGNAKTGGLVAAFSNAYYDHSGVPIVGVSASKGGTAMTAWLPSGTLLPDAIARYNAAKTYLSGKGYTVRHSYLVWLQGETDGTTTTTDDDEAYIANFGAMWAALKTAGMEKCLLLRIGNANSASLDYSLMIEKQTILAKTNPDVVMVSTLLASYKARSMMKDEYHFTQAAYNEMGTDAGTNAAQYVNTGVEPTMYDPQYNSLYYPGYPVSEADAARGLGDVATVAQTLSYLGIT